MGSGGDGSASRERPVGGKRFQHIACCRWRWGLAGQLGFFHVGGLGPRVWLLGGILMLAVANDMVDCKEQTQADDAEHAEAAV